MWNKCGMWNDLQQPIDHSFSYLIQHNCDEWNFLAILFGTVCHSSFFQPQHISSLFFHFRYIISTYVLRGYLLPYVQQPSSNGAFAHSLARPWGGGGSSFLSLHFDGAIFLLHRSRPPIGPACLTGANDCAAARLDCDTSDIWCTDINVISADQQASK